MLLSEHRRNQTVLLLGNFGRVSNVALWLGLGCAWVMEKAGKLVYAHFEQSSATRNAIQIKARRPHDFIAQF